MEEVSTSCKEGHCTRDTNTQLVKSCHFSKHKKENVIVYQIDSIRHKKHHELEVHLKGIMRHKCSKLQGAKGGYI